MDAETGAETRPRPGLGCRDGGVPERSNGAVLKTADRRKAVRGFKSHPRRSPNRISLPRQELQGNHVPTVDKLLFRAGGVMNSSDVGGGFLIDRVSLASSANDHK